MENAADLQTCDRIQTDSRCLLGKTVHNEEWPRISLYISICILVSLISVLVRNEHICQCVKIALVCHVQRLFHRQVCTWENFVSVFFSASEIKERDVINQNGPLLGDRNRKSVECQCTHLHDVEIKISQAIIFRFQGREATMCAIV